LIIKEIMHRVMVEENEERKVAGRPLLKSLPKPCDYFDLIGGTSTGGCASLDFFGYHNANHVRRIIALMLGRMQMDVDTAINCYDKLAEQVFSHLKRGTGDGKFKATKLEEAIKATVKEVTGDSETPLLEVGEPTCRT
jgi:hypothetical protein